MGHHLLQPSVSCPELIGRSAHLVAVERLLAGVGAGAAVPRVLLISGEAGVGKSRLLAAIRERAAQSGWEILASTCFEPYQTIPYAPLVDLAGSAQMQSTDAALTLTAMLDSMALAGVSDEPAMGLRPDTTQQRRLFHALLAWLAERAAERPLLVVVEDLHWSDAASLAFLPVFARSVGSRRILLATTFRAEEGSPPLTGVLTELERQRLAVEVALGPLSQAEVAAMVRACLALPGPALPELSAALHAHTDGNPFFIEETLTALMAAGQLAFVDGTWRHTGPDALQVPRTVHEAVRRRTALLGPAAREVLTVAAALGRRFSFTLLHRTTGFDEPQLLALLKELIAAQLIVEESAELFAFRHALSRAAIYDSLLGRERQLLHRRLAEALAETDAHPGDLALHFAAAGIWDRALHYATAAADQARRLHAPHEAIAHLTRALEAAQHLPATARAPLLHLRGQAHETLGSFAAALADYDAALAEATAAGHPADEWQALLDLGFLWSARDYVRAGDYLGRMLERARSMADPARLARSLNRFGNWQLNRDRPGTARRLHAEALAIFEQLGDTAGVAETLDLLGVSCLIAGDIAESARYLERAIELSTALDDRQGLIHSTLQLTVRVELDIEAVPVAPLAPRGAPLERALQQARAMQWRVGEALALMNLGAHLAGIGAFDQALPLLQASRALAAEIEHQECLTHADLHLGTLYLQLQCLPEAVAHLQQAVDRAQQSGHLVMIGTTGGLLALAYAEQRSLERAEATLAEAVVRRQDLGEASLSTHQLRRVTAALALHRGVPERALEIVDGLVADIVNPERLAIPALWLLRGQALLALRRFQEAAEVLAAGLTAAREQGRSPLCWRFEVALSAAATGLRRRDDAARWLDAARTGIDALAATISDPELRERFRAGALATLPETTPLTPRQALKHVFGGLTDRELEVARLIARGYTSRQIADILTVSERTVTTHVSNILAKLGFSSRAQVARWVAEQGIAPA